MKKNIIIGAIYVLIVLLFTVIPSYMSDIFKIRGTIWGIVPVGLSYLGLVFPHVLEQKNGKPTLQIIVVGGLLVLGLLMFIGFDGNLFGIAERP